MAIPALLLILYRLLQNLYDEIVQYVSALVWVHHHTVSSITES